MPCWSVVTNTVELENCGDHDLLEKALKEIGSDVRRNGTSFTFTTKSGYRVSIINGTAESQLTKSSLAEVVGSIKKEYSRQSMFATAKRFGWTVKKETVSAQYARN